MDDLQLSHVPMTRTGMLIRRPVADVFEAFANPDITTAFWFTRSSPTTVEWTFSPRQADGSRLVPAPVGAGAGSPGVVARPDAPSRGAARTQCNSGGARRQWLSFSFRSR